MRQKPAKAEIVPAGLHPWRVLQEFDQALPRAAAKLEINLADADRERQLSQARCLGLFLFGLFNPVIESRRGLCAVTSTGAGAAGGFGRPDTSGQVLGNAACD